MAWQAGERDKGILVPGLRARRPLREGYRTHAQAGSSTRGRMPVRHLCQREGEAALALCARSRVGLDGRDCAHWQLVSELRGPDAHEEPRETFAI